LIEVSLFLIEVSLFTSANATRFVAALVRERQQVTEVPGRRCFVASGPQHFEFYQTVLPGLPFTIAHEMAQRCFSQSESQRTLSVFNAIWSLTRFWRCLRCYLRQGGALLGV
jgi:hypothetical protein